MTLKMKRDYAEAIKQKDTKRVFQIFWDNLNFFKDEMREIYEDWLAGKKISQKQDEFYRAEYAKTWNSFVKFNPLPQISGHRAYNIKDLIPKNKKKLTGYEKNIHEYVKWIVRYSAHIVKEETKNIQKEFILITVLRAIDISIDLTSMEVNLDDVLRYVDDVYKEIQQGKFTPPPIINYWDGELYEGHLSSSRKVALYRGKILKRWLNQYLMEYKDCNKIEKPTRVEVKDYLIKKCANSGDERLRIFREKMSDKTLSKLLVGCEHLISKSHTPNVFSDNITTPVSAQNEKKKLTLMEVYDLLKVAYGNKNN